MAGEYRQAKVLDQLDASWVKDIRAGRLRIARTDQPMHGVTQRPELSEPMAAEYERIGMTELAEGLRSETRVPVWVVHTGYSRAWAPGELFMTS